MPDRLKFIKDVEATVIAPPDSRVRRTFDALDELRAENARLQRELDEAREENRRLKNSTGQPPPIPVVAASPVVLVPTQEESKDDASVRFSLLELK